MRVIRMADIKASSIGIIPLYLSRVLPGRRQTLMGGKISGRPKNSDKSFLKANCRRGGSVVAQLFDMVQE
jgi:hypothetical protein